MITRSKVSKSLDFQSRNSVSSKEIPFVYESTLANLKIQRINELMSQSNIYNEDLPKSLQVKKRISNKVRISFPKGHSLEVNENKPCYFKSKFERDSKFKDIATLGGRLKDWSSCHFLTRD